MSIKCGSVLLIPDAGDHVLSRGWSFRPQIWGIYIERAMQSPIFGEGILTDRRTYVYAPPFDGLVPDAHSAYIGTLRDGGLVGLGLLLSVFVAALWQGARGTLKFGAYLSLALGLQVMAFIATDTDRLITRTGGQWIFLWLPLALIMTDPAVRARGASDTGRQSSAP